MFMFNFYFQYLKSPLLKKTQYFMNEILQVKGWKSLILTKSGRFPTRMWQDSIDGMPAAISLLTIVLI